MIGRLRMQDDVDGLRCPETFNDCPLMDGVLYVWVVCLIQYSNPNYNQRIMSDFQKSSTIVWVMPLEVWTVILALLNYTV